MDIKISRGDIVILLYREIQLLLREDRTDREPVIVSHVVSVHVFLHQDDRRLSDLLVLVEILSRFSDRRSRLVQTEEHRRVFDHRHVVCLQQRLPDSQDIVG